MFTDSDPDDSDGINYGPSEANLTHTDGGSEFFFDVKQESSVVRIYGDKIYRSGLTLENKDTIMYALSKEVIEQRALMDLWIKLNVLRKKCEGRKVDMGFLWTL